MTAFCRAERRRIVIVEDQETSRDMLRWLLESDGWEVFAAADGPSSLGSIQRNRPDVVLIDLGLPGMDGLETARRIRSDPSNATLALIALTGHGGGLARAATRGAGFDAHLVKPLKPDALLQILNMRYP